MTYNQGCKQLTHLSKTGAFINRSPFSKAIFLTVKEVVICRGKGIVADLCTPSVKNFPTDESIIRKFFLSSTFKL